MRKETKLGKKKKREKAYKLMQNAIRYSDILKGRKLLKQAENRGYRTTKSNF